MKDRYGTPFNKPYRFFCWRYNVGESPLYDGKGQTYYRPFWVGLKCWLKWDLGAKI